jgi:hypothetical protein
MPRRRLPVPRTILVVGIAAIALTVSLDLTIQSFLLPIWGVDAVVPYRAAARWLAGGEPYLASAFAAGSGYDVPFLYPPPFLVAFAPLTLLPVEAVIVAANVVALLASYAALRRLGIAPLLVPLVLLWPPFSGAIAGGNLQAVMFAAFTWLYWDRARPGYPHPVAREPAVATRPALIDGLLAAVIPAIKVSQAHAYVGLLRLRPRAALLGALAVAVAVAALLLLVGPSVWVAWLQQSARAADPTWPLRGSSLTHDLPAIATTAFTGLSMLAALAVPRARAGAWIGLLTVIGAPTLRLYGVIFAVPAMLELRRELCLIAAILVASYTFEGLWLGIGLVAVAYALAARFPVLLEPRPTGDLRP